MDVRGWFRFSLRAALLKIFDLSTTLNQSHFFGVEQENLILPVLARDEEPQKTTQESMFNYVRLSEGGEPCVQGEMRSEVDIIATMAEQLLPEESPQQNW